MIHTCHTYRVSLHNCSHLPYIINHYKSLGFFTPLYNRMIAPSSSFLANLVTLNESQDHSHWYQNHHIKFERNQFTSDQTQASLKHILYTITLLELAPLNANNGKKKKNSMCLNRPTGHGRIPNLIQTEWEICKKISSDVSSFSQNCKGNSNWNQTMHPRGIFHHIKNESNWWICKCPNASQC